MRVLSFSELNQVAGGEQNDAAQAMRNAAFGDTELQAKQALGAAIRGVVTFTINVTAGVVGNAIYSRITAPSPAFGNGNGATGPGYSGAGIGGSVSQGSTGSSHFG